MHAGCKCIEVFQSMYYVAQNDLYNAMNPLERNISARTRWQETIIQKGTTIQEKAGLYTLFYRWHPQRSSSAWIHWDGGLKLLVYWSTVTDGNDSANNWPVLRQSLHTLPSIRMIAYVMYVCIFNVFSNLILALKLERDLTLCEKKEKLPRTPCRSFPLPSKTV